MSNMRNTEDEKDAKKRNLTDTLRDAVFLATLGSVFLAITGPFDTYGAGPFWARLMFWSVIVMSSVLLAFAIKPLAVKCFPRSLLLQELATLTVFTSIFVPCLIYWIDLDVLLEKERVTSTLQVTLYVFGIGFLVGFALHFMPKLLSRWGGKLASPEVQLPVARLVRRLPEGFSGKVLRLSGDGHLVKVSTTQGIFEVRMRLGDAVDEMDSVPGFCCHRSHWVATEAVENQRQKKGRNFLVLSNGDEVPVGPKYQPALEAAGFVFDRGIEKQNA